MRKRDHGVYSENETFLENLSQQAKGFGLEALLASANDAIAQELAQEAAASQVNEMVEGQKLEQVEQPQTNEELDWQTLGFAMLLLLAFIAGSLVQLRPIRIQST